VIRGREPGHVQAGFGDDLPGELEADAGDLREPLRRGQHSGARSRAGGRDAVRGDPPGGGDGVQRRFELVVDLGASRSSRVMWSMWRRISTGWSAAPARRQAGAAAPGGRPRRAAAMSCRCRPGRDDRHLPHRRTIQSGPRTRLAGHVAEGKVITESNRVLAYLCKIAAVGAVRDSRGMIANTTQNR
jgi:hypothetical protein